MKSVVSAIPLRLGTLAVLALAIAFALAPAAAHAQEVMRSFRAIYQVNGDGSLLVTETITWDFGDAPDRHGIFRYLFTRIPCPDPPADASSDELQLHPCPDGHERVYRVDLLSVHDGAGAGLQYETTSEGGSLIIRIGSPDVTVTGQQTYVIRYRVEGALDAYGGHDELYWDVLGEWSTTVEQVEVTVLSPAGELADGRCFQGGFGADEACDARVQGNEAVFRSTRPLAPGEQLTIVAGWPKGVLTVPPPITEDIVSIDDFFELDWLEFGGAALLFLASIPAVVLLWWRNGRDRAYRSIYYLTNDPTAQTRPLFGRQDLVVEFLPPEDLRPAQMGVVLDERADTLDVTATIVDLAVHGYLHITEIPKDGWFGKTDWLLTRTEPEHADDLLPYERTILNGLFDSQSERKVSELKYKFLDDLKRAKKQLYDDAMKRKWFRQRPETAKLTWAGIGVAVVVAGVLAMVIFGIVLGRALIGAGIVLGGLLLLAMAPAMSSRTAKGSEALRRILGFRRYIVTAETRLQEFNEQQNIFARYLPYAMVFGAVDKWAKAFEQLGDEYVQASTRGWYASAGAFNIAAFNSGLHSFSDNISSTITATRSSSGGSGFSGGGFSGGGGGGGGGGSW